MTPSFWKKKPGTPVLGFASLGLDSSVSSGGKDKAPVNPCKQIENSVPSYDQKTKEFRGCKLVKIKPGSMYASLGLKEGEVVIPAGTSNDGSMVMELRSTLKAVSPDDKSK